VTHAPANPTKFVAALTSLMALVHHPQTVSAAELDYSYIELGYAIDSTVEAIGKTYDSDESYRALGSYLINPSLFLWGHGYSAGYDLLGADDFEVSGYSLGLGYRARVNSDAARPVDCFALLSYEHRRTLSEVSQVEHVVTHDGGGLKAGIRASVTEKLQVSLDAYEQSFGTGFLGRNGDLDGLSFELGGVLDLSDRWSLTAAYRTGEMDYRTLANFPDQYEIEVDRDEVFVGFRWSPR
jgi:hypothetical protein